MVREEPIVDHHRPLHQRADAIISVLAGGILGAAARETVEQALPTAARGFPVATFIINLAGAFVLGGLLEALARTDGAAGWQRLVRLGGGTGFCGGFTTYSTLAVETVQLGRHGAPATAVLYIAASVLGGLLAVWVGIATGAAVARTRALPGHPELPFDPDIDPGGARS